MTILDSNSSTSPDLLSALVDGELSGGKLADGVAQADLQDVFKSSALQSDWNAYQVIGEVLRGNATEPQGADPAFLRRVNLRLANEQIAAPVLIAATHGSVVMRDQPAVNDGVFRWKLVAGFASLGAALVVAWSFTASPDASTAAQLSQNQAAEQVLVASPLGPMVRDTRLEELMTAHKQLGGSSLQAPSGFLRNAGFENSQSGQR